MRKIILREAMKKVTVTLLVALLSMMLVCSGAFAKGKPEAPGASQKEKEKVKIVSQKQENEEQGQQDEGESELTQTENQAKNKGQAKKLEERIKVRGMNLKFDVPPVIKEGRTLIPVRAVMNGLGASVEWNDEEKTVTITRDDKTIILNLQPNPETGKYTATVNDETIELDVPAQLISNRTFVPLRFIAQTLGETVDYDEETGEIDIGDEEEDTDEDTDEDSDDEDTDEDDAEEDDSEDEEDTEEDDAEDDEDNVEDEE